MGFNELNSVEHYIVHQLSGVNLNDSNAAEPKVGYGVQWEFKSADQLQRTVNEVLVESELKAALVRLNPEINLIPDLADEVIYKLRAVLIAVNQVGLVKANEEFFKWMTGDKMVDERMVKKVPADEMYLAMELPAIERKRLFRGNKGAWVNAKKLGKRM